MAAKMQRIIELMQETQKSLSEPDNWTTFLRTAAWQYKYPFEDQVLIYAQRPDAVACASMEVWNKRMHRWINKGSKGIALLRETGGHYGLEYVFDVADTRDRYNRELQLWQYDEKYDSAIIETLENTFGEIKSSLGIRDAILNAVHNAVEDNKNDYIHEFDYIKDEGLLYGLDSVNLDMRFRQTAEVSVAYMVMRRMGLEPNDVIDYEDFEFIRDFNTPETISILGNAVSSISEHALRNISETIRAEQRREKFDDRGQLIAWEDVGKRIGELLELGRFAPQETLDSINEYERKKTADAVWYMYRDLDTKQFPELKELFEEWFKGGYPDSTARIAELLKQPEYVIDLVSIAGNLTQRYYDEPDIMRWRMFSPDKVLPMLSDLELARKTFTADRYQQPSAQRFITEDEIDRLFMRDSGFDRGKIRIYLYFQEHTDKKERVDFLKNEYGTGGSGGGIFSENHDAKGITLSRGDISSPLAKVSISWSRAEQRIDSLIKAGRYMTEREINEDIPRYLSEREQLKIRNEKITYLYDMDKRSPEERLEALPKRMRYFMDVMDESGKRFFTEYGIEHLLNETEIGIADAIKDAETRRRLSECMQRLGGAATDILDRNSGYSFSEELKELKVINLHRVGDFYEMFGDEAVEAVKALDIALTTRRAVLCRI